MKLFLQIITKQNHDLIFSELKTTYNIISVCRVCRHVCCIHASAHVRTYSHAHVHAYALAQLFVGRQTVGD